METVEMDLMQAQIAELTTIVTQNSRDIVELKKNTSSNTIETYTGTLDGLKNKFVDIAIAKYGISVDAINMLVADIENGNISGELEIDASALGLSTYKDPIFGRTTLSGGDVGIFIQGVKNDPHIDDWASYTINLSWGTNAPTNAAWSQNGTTVTNISTYMSAIPYTLTLYFHKMPEE